MSKNGKARREEPATGLGSVAIVSLKEDRDLAIEYRRVWAAGGDPIELRWAAKAGEALEAAKAMTFRQRTEVCTPAHSAG